MYNKNYNCILPRAINMVIPKWPFPSHLLQSSPWFTWRMKEDLRRVKQSSQCGLIGTCDKHCYPAPWWCGRPIKVFSNWIFLSSTSHTHKRTQQFGAKEKPQNIGVNVGAQNEDNGHWENAMLFGNFSPYSEYQTDPIRLTQVVLKWKKK